MRILFVTPYPPSRIRVRSYGFLKQLRRNHEVVVLALCSSKQELADVEVLRSQGYEVVVVQESRRQAMLRSGLALIGSRSLHVAYASSPRFTHALQHLCLQRHFDVVHVEHLRGIAAIEPLVDTLPLVWDAVDCLNLLYKHTIVAGPNLAMRAMAMLEYKRIQQYEARMVNKLQHVLVTSERDRQALIQLRCIQVADEIRDDSQPGSAIGVLSNGVDLDHFRPIQQKRRRFNLVFSGTMSYHPNVATALHLYRQIMPLIWQHRPEVTLTIVGSRPPKAIQRMASDPRVEVTGYVDDIRPYIGRAEVMVCPMVYSVGIQNKVLEAMALETPVIVAPQSAEVFEACQGRDLLVSETPQKFAEAALRLLDDAELRTMLSRYGRTYVEQYHDWQAVTDRLVDIYQQAIATYERRNSASLV
jgi:polysaccharide biosynthesis protein PslH